MAAGCNEVVMVFIVSSSSGREEKDDVTWCHTFRQCVDGKKTAWKLTSFGTKLSGIFQKWNLQKLGCGAKALEYNNLKWCQKTSYLFGQISTHCLYLIKEAAINAAISNCLFFRSVFTFAKAS